MDQELKEVLRVINDRFDKMDVRFDRMDERFDRMDERFDGVDRRIDGVDKRIDGLDARLSRVENDVTSIKLTIENELRPNIQTLAGVCLDTNRKLDEYIEKNDSKVEQLDLRVSNLEIQKYLKNRNHRRKAGSSE